MCHKFILSTKLIKKVIVLKQKEQLPFPVFYLLSTGIWRIRMIFPRRFNRLEKNLFPESNYLLILKTFITDRFTFMEESIKVFRLVNVSKIIFYLNFYGRKLAINLKFLWKSSHCLILPLFEDATLSTPSNHSRWIDR